MKASSLGSLAAVTGAAHVVALSLVFGVRHVGYCLTALLSGALIWSMVCSLHGWRRGAAAAVGFLIALGIQQAAVRHWQADLPEGGWSLAQFVALHVIVGFGVGRLAS